MNQKPRILIVDDIQVNLILLEALLRKLEVEMIKATSGFEAIEKTKGLELALAILDVRMPGMDGYELARRLNESRIEDKVPVIFLTANYMDESEISIGYESGAVDYLIKPFNTEFLVSKVNVFLDLFRQKQLIKENAALLKKSSDELIRLNKALQQSEEKYRSYINHAPDGVIIADNTGKFLEVNVAAGNITGYSPDELLNMSLYDIFSEDVSKEKPFALCNAEHKTPQNQELLFKRKNGPPHWMSLGSVGLAEGLHLCFIKDITRRKKAEQKLQNSLEQFQLLTKHVEEVRENERVVIARELHDDLGQALTAVKIDLGILKQKVSEQDVISRIDKISELVRDTIFTVQRLTSQLRPQIIDDLGLEAAIEWYTNEFAERNQLSVYRQIQPGIILSPSTSLIVFRIMQESLTNISRYARASRVDITLVESKGKILFSISDDGIGISESEIKSGKSFGIMGMRERTASLNGTFCISKGKDKGTVIKISFPLNNNKSNETNTLR